MKLNILKYIFSLSIIISSITAVQAQTTQGTDFYLSFGNNKNKSATDINLQIRVVATKATKVTYTFTQNGSQETREIAAGEVNTFVLDETQRKLVYLNALNGSMSTFSNLSLYIHSTEPVSVYALNTIAFWTDATNVLPVNTLGVDYYHISYAPSNDNGDAAARYDGYTIVATEDGTTVSVNGTTLNATPLTKGQVYHVYQSTDMTGKHITSNHPIALFSNNVCALVPSDKTASDYLFQQMLPVSAWGKNHFVPATIRGIERVRIVASQDNTTITQTGGTVKTGSLTLNKGQFVELEITLAAGGCYISADKPVGVCSYLVGIYATATPYKEGDPAIAWVPPVEQFIDSATIAPFIPDGATELKAHYALIVARTNSLSETTMRIGAGAATALSGGTWTTGANPDYSFYNLPLTNTTQSCTFANPHGLAIMGYGVGRMEAYYYLAASAVKDISAAFYVNGELYSDVNGKEYCFLRSLHIKAEIEDASADLKWFIDGDLQVTDQLEWDLDLTSLSPDVAHTIRMDVTDTNNNKTKTYETTIKLCPRMIIPVNRRFRN